MERIARLVMHHRRIVSALILDAPPAFRPSDDLMPTHLDPVDDLVGNCPGHGAEPRLPV